MGECSEVLENGISIFGPHQSINDILSVLERSKTSTSELVEQEAQVALVSSVSNLSNGVSYVEGNMFTTCSSIYSPFYPGPIDAKIEVPMEFNA